MGAWEEKYSTRLITEIFPGLCHSFILITVLPSSRNTFRIALPELSIVIQKSPVFLLLKSREKNEAQTPRFLILYK